MVFRGREFQYLPAAALLGIPAQQLHPEQNRFRRNPLSGAGQHLERAQNQVVAKHSRRRFAHRAMNRGEASPLVRAINNIVVNQRGSMQQFHGFGGWQCVGWVTACHRRREEHQRGANHLAALEIAGQRG